MGLTSVTHVHSVGIFSFAKNHIRKHEDLVRVCFIHVTTHATTYCVYASYFYSDLNTENVVLKNFINCAVSEVLNDLKSKRIKP